LRGAAGKRLARAADNEDVKRTGVIIYWKRVVFSAALFWFWYLTPVVASHMEQAHTLAPLASLLGQ
jgi:hypothetical protein